MIYVKRERAGRWHIRESVIAGDAITKCGKRMTDEVNRDGALTTFYDDDGQPAAEMLAAAGVCENCGESSLADSISG